MSASDRDISAWGDRIGPVVLPSLRYAGWRAWLLVAAAAVFVAARFLMPDRLVDAAAAQRLDVSHPVAQLAEQIQTLAAETIIDHREAVDLASIWEDLPHHDRMVTIGPWLTVAALTLFLLEILQRRSGVLLMIARGRRRTGGEQGGCRTRACVRWHRRCLRAGLPARTVTDQMSRVQCRCGFGLRRGSKSRWRVERRLRCQVPLQSFGITAPANGLPWRAIRPRREAAHGQARRINDDNTH